MGRTIQLCDLFQKGVPPVAGGSLNQTSWFISASNCLSYEDALALEELTR